MSNHAPPGALADQEAVNSKLRRIRTLSVADDPRTPDSSAALENLPQTRLSCYHPVTMSEVVYRSHVRIERVKGPVRRAYLPAEASP